MAMQTRDDVLKEIMAHWRETAEDRLKRLEAEEPEFAARIEASENSEKLSVIDKLMIWDIHNGDM